MKKIVPTFGWVVIALVGAAFQLALWIPHLNAQITTGPNTTTVNQIPSSNPTISGATFTGALTNTTLLGIPTTGFLLPNPPGWAATNTSPARQLVIFNIDVTPTASLQGALNVFWTNSAGVTSNRFTTGVGLVAQTFTCTGILESNGAVQITTNRLNGATVVLSLINSSATPLP